jgi:asparagine synthase (glutamine-hydrolysing)
MCGLAGYLTHPGTETRVLRAVARDMASRIRHRGPDDSGEWVDPVAGIALGHRRLAIIDLTPHGHQPMISHSQRYVLAYNGEIYNHAELRAELCAADPALPWRGHSDTEVALATIERWGIEAALPRFNGMFAIALWDRQTRRLYLARDRFGEKPLYYASVNGCFLFGSELKALTAHPAWTGEIDRGALRLYMRFNYVPAPFTIYSCARKLPASCLLTVAVDAAGGTFRVGEPKEYWSATEIALAARERPLTDQIAAKAELRELLGRVVDARLMADVPLGAFLSGGIDSSVVVALMQKSASEAVRTFTIGYEDPEYDESPHAAQVAAHLGTAHTCDLVTPAEAQEAILHMPSMFDEPFADSSQIPTFLVSRAARKDVTVALTGDGGDELFGGYDRYFVGGRVFPKIRAVPSFARRPLAAVIRSLPPGYWQSILTGMRRIGGRSLLTDLSGERLHRLSLQLRAESESQMYEIMMARPEDGSVLLGNGEERRALHGGESGWAPLLPDAEAMMLFDTLNILPDDFLVKVDRAAMSVGLETRAPLLDPRLFEFAWRIPLTWKLGAHSGKLFMRELLSELVPARLVDRPKQGFSVPVGRWLKGPLRDWAEALLDERRLRSEGFLAPQSVRRKWAEHLAGTHDRQNEIWSAVVFQEWLASTRTQATAVLTNAGATANIVSDNPDSRQVPRRRAIRLLVWTSIPTHHQSAFFDALRQRGIDLVVHYLRHVNPSRLDMGWEEHTALPLGERYVPETLRALDDCPDWSERIHVIPGYSTVFLLRLALLLSQKGIPWLHWGEHSRPRIRSRATFLIKRFYGHLIQRYGVGALAIGDLARTEFLGWGVSEDRIRFLPYAVAGFSGSAAPGIADRRPGARFLFLGSLYPLKGIDLLLTAMRDVLAAFPDARLELAGNDLSAGRYGRDAARLGINYAVRFTGVVDAGQVGTVLLRNEVLILPSRHDGWGVVLNEAASLGKAIIASDASGAAHHLVRPGFNGFRFPSGSSGALAMAMAEYCRDPGLAARHGAESLRIFAEFTPQRNAQRLEEALDSLQPQICADASCVS